MATYFNDKRAWDPTGDMMCLSEVRQCCEVAGVPLDEFLLHYKLNFPHSQGYVFDTSVVVNFICWCMKHHGKLHKRY